MCATAPSLVVRDATSADAQVLMTMIRELAVYEKLEHEVVATVEAIRQWLFGPNAIAHALIAEIDGQPVGYAVYFRYYSTFRGKPGMYLEDIYVRDSSRGAGVGETLIRRVAQVAIEQECPRLEWNVLDWNEPAIGFYRRLGAKPEPTGWTKYFVQDESLHRLADKRT